MNYIKRYKKYISIGIFLIGIILVVLLFSLLKDDEKDEYVFANVTTNTNIQTKNSSFYVDIKGAVKKPGVYLVNSDNIVIDVITLAGGLSKNAYTNNINLAEHVTKEMVIYVYNKKEVKNNQIPLSNTTCTTNVIEIANNCITTTSSEKTTSNNTISGNKETNNSLVNINTASKEELMNVPNIGSSKADSIIIYRMETPFKTIEDIMNVSGIGETLFAKIKDYITV